MTSEIMNNISFTINDESDVYYNRDNKAVPRVTNILSSMIHSDQLMYWSNRLGLRGMKYKDELDKAARFGTRAHNCIENYLKNQIKQENNIPFLGYLLWEKVLSEKFIYPRPLLIEHKLTCDWFGGTCDALFEIGGRIYLTDFKTSNHVTFKYFLQLAAYKYMLELEGYKIDGVIVLQLDKKEPGFNEFLLDFLNPEHFNFMQHCTEAFFALVYGYYQVERIKGEYTTLFGST